MDEARRYQQALSFSRQLAAAHAALVEATHKSDDLVASVYALGKFCATPACPMAQLTAAFPEFAAKLVRSFRAHPLRELHIEQLEGDALDAVIAGADELAAALAPMYRELQDVGRFLARAGGLLADLHQLLIPVTPATAPQVLELFMTLLANAARLVLLMERVPWKLLVQVYTIVVGALASNGGGSAAARASTNGLLGAVGGAAAPPGRTAVLGLLEALQQPVPHLQRLFAPVAARVSQVLELAVSPVLDHVARADVLAASGVFDASQLLLAPSSSSQDQQHHHHHHNSQQQQQQQRQLGVTGLSLHRTYAVLQRLDDYRAWATLGLLACPAALSGVGAQRLLSSLLADGFLLPVHGDVALPAHALFAAHVAPALEAQLAALLAGECASAAEREARLGAARALVGRAHAEAAARAPAEHAARRRLAARALSDLRALLEEDAALLPQALPVVLAACAYAKSELLWYFRHADEALPLPSGGGGGASGTAAAAAAAGGAGQTTAAAAAAAAAASGDATATTGPAAGAAVAACVTGGAATSAAAAASSADTPAAAAAAAASSVAAAASAAANKLLSAVGVSGGGGGGPSPPVGHDPHAAVLLGHLTAVHDLLEQQAALLQGHQRELMRAVLEQQVLPETRAVLAAADRSGRELPPTGGGGGGGRVVPRVLLPLIEGVVRPLAELCGAEDAAALVAAAATPGSSAAAAAAAAAAEAAAAAAANDGGDDGAEHAAAAAVRGAQQSMALLTMLLASRNLWMRPAVVEAPAQDPQYLEALGRLLELAPSACALLEALEAPCGLAPLAHHQRKLAALQRAVLADRGLSGREALEHLPGLTRALRWFEHNQPVVDAATGAGPRDYAAEAAALATALLEEQAAAVAGLLRQMARELTAASPVVRPSSDAASAGAAPADAAAAAAVAAGGGAAPASARSRALSLAAALDRAGAVRVSSGRLVVPGEFLRAALQRCLLDRVTELAAVTAGAAGGGDQLPPVPSALVRRLDDVLWAAAQLQEAVSFDVRPELWRVLLNHAQPAWVLPPSQPQQPQSAPAPPAPVASIVDGYAAWLAAAVVRDARGVGVVYAPALRRFTCVAGGAGTAAALEARASLPELAALLRAFGPYAAARLAEATEAAALDCLGQLDACLQRWRAPLDAATAAAVRDDACADAAAAAAAAVGADGAGQALAPTRQLGRCLALRQLLGEAMAAALGAELPAVPATVAAVASNAAGAADGPSPGRHVCDVFQLPRPGARADGSPASPDPAVVAALVGSNNVERHAAWGNLPALLGVALSSPAVGPAALLLPERALSSELHAVAHAAKCLALAQQAAADRVLPCGGRFLQPGAGVSDRRGDQPAAAALATFAKVASAAAHASRGGGGGAADGSIGARTTKALLLGSLACRELPASRLAADAWLPASRLRSALAQAAL